MAHQHIQFGSIIHHDNVPEPNGRLAGRHFGVVISPDDDVKAGKDLRVAVVTTTFTQPLPPGCFKMDYIAGHHHPVTGFSELCVAKATWIAKLPQSECAFNGKHVLPKTARAIDAHYKMLQQQARDYFAKKRAGEAEPKAEN